MSTISLVINTLNEEANIRECILSAREIVDEIVVCDMYSDDRTVDIARDLGAKVVFHDRVGYVEPARHAAISAASSEWVLVLDADERLTERLASKLKELSANDQVDTIAFWSLYWYFGGWVRHGGFFNGGWIRMFRRQAYLDNYTESENMVHRGMRGLLQVKRRVDLPDDYYMLHWAYPDLEKYAAKTVGKYAQIEGRELFEQGEPFSVGKLIVRPLRTFLGAYIARKGYRDGVRGFVLAVLYATYRFVMWATVWMLEEEAKRKASEPGAALPKASS